MPHTTSLLTRATLQDHLIEVKGGLFVMGYWDTGDSDNKPAHPVQLDDFLMLRYPLTQSLWEEVMGENPSRFKGAHRPVEEVSWYEAVNFCNRLSELEGLPPAYGRGEREDAYFHLNARAERTEDLWEVKGYRLPTEAEWEYAAMGGPLAPKDERGRHCPLTEYAGSNFLEEVGWYAENSYGKTKEVGLKLPNELGLYDMSGNVWEWCWDRYEGGYYEKCRAEGLLRNPLGPVEGGIRVMRGGGWRHWAGYCCLSDRDFWYPQNRGDFQGFRLVRSS